MTKFIFFIAFIMLVFAQDKTIQGFANFDFYLNDSDSASSGFTVGQYDTYISGSISDNISFLSELVVEYDDGWIVDLERLWMNYYINDLLSFSVGKFHTPIGFWNREYHHGTLLYASVDRPLYLLFEDEGGILPIHTTGLMISGMNISSLKLYYDILIGNGIGSTPTADNDSFKSITAYIHTKAIQNLDFGVSFYLDKIAKGAIADAHGEDALSEEVKQQLISFSLVYDNEIVQLLSEFLLATNEGKESAVSNTSTGFYLLFKYSLSDQISPFFKFDYLKIDAADPFYELNTKKSAISFGFKYDFSYLANIKFQFTHSDDKLINEQFNLLKTQFSVGF